MWKRYTNAALQKNHPHQILSPFPHLFLQRQSILGACETLQHPLSPLTLNSLKITVCILKRVSHALSPQLPTHPLDGLIAKVIRGVARVVSWVQARPGSLVWKRSCWWFGWENRSLAKDGFAAHFRSDVWWPQDCFPHRAEKQFMKNDVMAHGDYLDAPSKLTHRVYTLPWPEDLNIISTDRRLWSSMCTCNWPLKGFLEQILWNWKLCTHKSCRPHLHCKPQIWPHHSLTHCFVFTESLLTLGSNIEKDKSSFLVEFPEYLRNFSRFFFKLFPL